MPDPRALRIDVGPFHLAPTPDAATWTAAARAAGGAQARASSGAQAAGADASPGITATWGDWVAFAHKVLRADELWRAGEARGDAWDEGFAAARDAAAVNPYR
ncbi:hypothetical protein M3672_07915 [Microbacterium enclense]|uniref:Uncharacterized protein n=1 Tax=Microbacterium enclense TaxID=993073 RepID=A0A1G6HEV4_9MICO|nr:hypothetical protein [Microbacterium enclense]KSU55261.1 hypothetical protein AS029_04305 [Microbacterium enclense]MCM3614366.1 hypothetical protein [Microbacterium enclense]SDB92648.1 hypothetical protein SAMN05216418_1110 [Microbacterium enclense]